MTITHSPLAWTDAELAEIRERLETEIVRLRQQIASAMAANASRLGDLSAIGDEIGDVGELAIELGEGATCADNEFSILEQYERALNRLDSSVYGVCMECNRPIAKRRMKALPRATHCVGCA